MNPSHVVSVGGTICPYVPSHSSSELSGKTRQTDLARTRPTRHRDFKGSTAFRQPAEEEPQEPAAHRGPTRRTGQTTRWRSRASTPTPAAAEADTPLSRTTPPRFPHRQASLVASLSGYRTGPDRWAIQRDRPPAASPPTRSRTPKDRWSHSNSYSNSSSLFHSTEPLPMTRRLATMPVTPSGTCRPRHPTHSNSGPPTDPFASRRARPPPPRALGHGPTRAAPLASGNSTWCNTARRWSSHMDDPCRGMESIDPSGDPSGQPCPRDHSALPLACSQAGSAGRSPRARSRGSPTSSRAGGSRQKVS